MCVFSLGIKPASAAFCVVKASSRPQWQIRMESCTAKVHIHTHKHTHIVKMVLVYLHCTLKPEHLIFNQNYRKKTEAAHSTHRSYLKTTSKCWLLTQSILVFLCSLLCQKLWPQRIWTGQRCNAGGTTVKTCLPLIVRQLSQGDLCTAVNSKLFLKVAKLFLWWFNAE